LTWCLGQPPEDATAEREKREGPLSQCRTNTTLPGGWTAPPTDDACNVSVIVKNKSCLNLDGSPSQLPAEGSSATGCGSTGEVALQRAMLNFATNVACTTEGVTPEPSCCTVTKEPVRGCLCR
jgi:hypothetical protein